MASRQPIQFLTALPLALVIVCCYLVWDEHYISHADGEVLVITTTSRNNPSAKFFSESVLNGARKAKEDSDELKLPMVAEINLDLSDNDLSASTLTYHLAQKISQHKIVGIISGGTSQTDGPLVKLSQQLHVPLLLAVATNDILTSNQLGQERGQGDLEQQKIEDLEQQKTEGEDFDQQRTGQTSKPMRTVFRMLPNNSIQAKDIADHAKKRWGTGTEVALIHEDNEYGNFLYAKLASLFSKDGSSLYSFVIEDNNSVPSILPSLDRIKDRLSGIVYLGYSQHAIDLMQGLNAYGINKLPTFLSDGCFSSDPDPDLKKVANKFQVPTTLFFPTRPWIGGEKPSGFNKFGYNAYILLAHLSESAANAKPDATLRDVLNDVGRRLERKDDFGKAHHSDFTLYTFGEDGEPLIRDQSGKLVPMPFDCEELYMPKTAKPSECETLVPTK